MWAAVPCFFQRHPSQNLLTVDYRKKITYTVRNKQHAGLTSGCKSLHADFTSAFSSIAFFFSREMLVVRFLRGFWSQSNLLSTFALHSARLNANIQSWIICTPVFPGRGNCQNMQHTVNRKINLEDSQMSIFDDFLCSVRHSLNTLN